MITRLLSNKPAFLPILEHYGIDLPKSPRGSIKLHCPFHDDSKPSLSVDVTVGAGKFKCFGCNAQGNILRFVELMDECTVRDAALKVAELVGIDVPEKDAPIRGAKTHQDRANGADTTNGASRPKERQVAAKSKLDAASEDETEDDQPINPPLSFELKLDPTHPYVIERLDQLNMGRKCMPRAELVETFGLGVCGRGMMKDRLCIPIHDEGDDLVAYAGRWALDEDSIPEGDDKYKLPPKFRKSRILFNLNRVLEKQYDPNRHQVVVTEGLFGAIRLHAMGVPAVALMGTSISEEQIKLIGADIDPEQLILLMDGDSEGQRAAEEFVLPALAKFFFVRNATALLEDGEQPDEMEDGRLLSVVLR